MTELSGSVFISGAIVLTLGMIAGVVVGSMLNANAAAHGLFYMNLAREAAKTAYARSEYLRDAESDEHLADIHFYAALLRSEDADADDLDAALSDIDDVNDLGIEDLDSGRDAVMVTEEGAIRVMPEDMEDD